MKRYPLGLLAFLACAALCAQTRDTVRFAYMADLHYPSDPGSIRSCVSHINAQDSLDFVIIGGDLTDFGTDEEIAEVKQILDGFTLPYYVVAGNHDAKWSESGCNTFRKVFGYEHFEFEAGGWRFLGCNSGPDMRMAPALLPQESMEWLRALEPGRKSIFVNHYPQDTSVLNYFDVTRELKRAGVRFCIGGHWHVNRALNYDGIPAVLGRSSLPSGNVPGYNIFRLAGDTVSISEVRVYGDSSYVRFPAWYCAVLEQVEDKTSYDADGIAENYPWLRYEVNARYPQVREVWKRRDVSNVVAGFARSGGVAYYTTASGCLRAVSLKDGREKWSRSFPGKIFSTPAVDGKTVVFGCTDGNVYAVSASGGRLKWSYKASKSVLASPVILDGKVFVGSSDGVFRALSLKDGSLIWEFRGVEGFVECRPYVDETQVVFGTWANRLYSLDTRTGELQWVWRCAKPSRMYSPAATYPVKAAGRIFVAVPDRRVYAIDAATGEQLFYVRGGREAVGLSGDGSTVYAKTMDHHSYAFAADVPLSSVDESGELPRECLKWYVENGTGYEISPTQILEKDGTVYFPTDKGNLFALSASDGHLQWIHKISLALINPMDIWTDRDGSTCILVSTMDGVITLLKI